MWIWSVQTCYSAAWDLSCIIWQLFTLLYQEDSSVNVSCSLTLLVVESSFWCHTTLVTLTQTNTESSLTSAESPSDGLLWDNYKFYPKFVACPTAYRVNPQIAHDCASHITHKHALRRWITNHLMWDDIFLDKNKWGLAPFSSVRGPLTKQSKVLRDYFQSLPCAFNGSGEKVNEFSTVSHDSPYSGHIERWRCTGLHQHADEDAAVEESVTAPWRWRSACAGHVWGASQRQAGENSFNKISALLCRFSL